MWVSLGMAGSPAAANFALSIAAEFCWARRSSIDCLKVADARERSGDEDGRQRRRKNEAGRVAADAVDDHPVGGDVAAHHAESLAERSFDNRQPVRDRIAFGNATAAFAVHAHRVYLVEVGQGTVPVREIADCADRSDVGVHRINALERDQLGRFWILCRQQLLEMLKIVVPEHALFAAAVLDAGNHRGVVELIREDHAVREELAQGRERGLVRNVARGEEKRAILAVQVGKLRLEFRVIVRVAADVAGAARARADVAKSGFHRLDDGTGAGPCRDSRWSTRR